MRSSLAAFSALIVLLASPMSAVQAPPGWSLVVDGYRRLLQEAGIVGSSLMIVRDSRIVARDNEGYQNLEKKEPVTDRTVYHWASITKTFTGIAIVQLRDRGLLSLDDPVVKYVPELRLAHDPFGDISQIKIHHLMSHSAGFRAATWPWGGGQPWHPFEPTTWEQLVAMMPYTEVMFEPGSRYSYSNPGVIFLGRIVQLLSGDDYVEQHGAVRLIGHSGDQNGFISHLYLHLPTRTAYLVSFNTDTRAAASRPSTRDVDARLRDLIVNSILH